MIEIALVTLIGLAFGSFVTLASYRLPRGEDIAVKPSRCPNCEHKLACGDLWPVASWLASGGKCRHCHAPVSPRYPLIELLTAALFLLIYSRFGISIAGVLLSFMAVALMIMVVVDLEHTIIPDALHLVLLPLGFAYHMAVGTPWGAIAGGFTVGMLAGLCLHHGYRWLRHTEGLGYGDVKFLAVAGLWLGVMPLVPFLFLAGLFGTLTGLLWLWRGWGALFPFGPALALALFLLVLYPEISGWFWNIGTLTSGLFF